jgi:hypothetical protein
MPESAVARLWGTAALTATLANTLAAEASRSAGGGARGDDIASSSTVAVDNRTQREYSLMARHQKCPRMLNNAPISLQAPRRAALATRRAAVQDLALHGAEIEAADLLQRLQ